MIIICRITDLANLLSTNQDKFDELLKSNQLKFEFSMIRIKKHWFKHDFYTCNDHKMQKLDFKYPVVGYGIFFKVIELLYQNNGKLEYDLDFISFAISYDKDVINSVLNDFDLFTIQDEVLYNNRVLESIKEITEKSEKARASANSRYGN